MPLDPALFEILNRAQAIGLLGPAPVERHRHHADAFRLAIPTGSVRVLDLGTGAGIPGLILATTLLESEWVLLDARERCARFLAEAVAELHLELRVSVARSRAEEAAHVPELRGTFDAVVARAFGPPAATAECGSGFLRVGGVLLVSEPPTSGGTRWSSEGLALLGLVAEPAVAGRGGRVQVLRQVSACPERFPRRVGIPTKRPLF